MNLKTTTEKIKTAISKRKVIELFYLLDDEEKMYFTVAPVRIEERNGKLYLLSLDQRDHAYAFDIARITAMDEYWADFNLCKDFNKELFKNKLLNEGNNINGYIMATNEKEANPEKLREELREIESGIKAIVGPRRDDDWVEIPPDIDRDKLSRLLRERRYRHAILFRKDPAGLEHFRKINAYLRELSDRMYKKGARVYRQYLTAGIDGDFNDDFMIEADLRFIYNGKNSIAVLGDEEHYGSDFDYMMNVCYDYSAGKPCAGASFSKSFRKSDRPEMTDSELELDNSDDRTDHHEMKIWIPEFEGIRICNAVNEICVYDTGYSVADLLRMNDFWCEVKAVFQHIRDQDGKAI